MLTKTVDGDKGEVEFCTDGKQWEMTSARAGDPTWATANSRQSRGTPSSATK